MVRYDPPLGRLLRGIIARRIPDWLRYGAAILIIAACLGLRLALPVSGVPFLVFIPGLIAASLLFGRGPGLLATLLSTAIAAFILIESAGVMAMTPSQTTSLIIYVIIGTGIAVLCHTLRATIVSLIQAEREKSLLFDELNHRTKNNLQMVASLLSMQARTVGENAARVALEDAVTRVQVIAKLHERLQPDGLDGLVNMRDYLDALCEDLGATLRKVRPVAVTVGAEPVVVRTAVAAPIGLIVNELITNCLKYAFPDGESGLISVVFEVAGQDYSLVVRDNGVGAPPDAKDGLGSRLTGMLVKQLNGRITRGHGAPGTVTTVTIPSQQGAVGAAA